MIAICVEDKPLLLEDLVRAVKASPRVEKAIAFADEHDALDWARENHFDAAFLDIRLHDMTGLELAERLAEKNPDALYVFCTGHKEYAFDAIQLHLRIGYLLKPIEADSVTCEIDKFLGKGKEKPLIVKCFGMFEAYVGDTPIPFRRSKAKELLAFLVDCRGAFVSAGEICAALWDDDGDSKKMYFRQLTMDLRQTLSAAGIPEVFLSRGNGYALDTSLIDCDYYRLLDGDTNAASHFVGQYMAGYSWAEPTAAWIASKLID